jgi:hypothetical protein
MQKTVSNPVRIGLIILAIGLLVGALIGYAQSLSNTYTISPEVYPEAPSYTVWMEGSNYFAKDANGIIAFSGTNASQILQNTLNASVNGGKIFVKEGNYTFNTSVVFPYGARSITVQGASGWSKSNNRSGAFLESTITADALFKTTPQTDSRSAFGLKFSDLTVVGPKTANSTGFLLTNVDTFEFSSCTILGFDVALNVSYRGTALAEQPGMGFIHDSIWGEGATSTSEFLLFDKSTEITISNSNFGWGNFTRAIHIKDSDKIRIGPNNEFNIGDTPSPVTEHIYIESSYGSPFIPNQIDIHDNWAYSEGATNKWIRIVDAPAINVWGVKSVDNTIQNGYNPDFFVNSPYAVSNWTNLVAQDMTYPPCQPGNNLRDLTGTCPAGSTYQNKWPSVSLYFLLNIPAASGVTVKLSRDGVNWATVYLNDAAVNNTTTYLVVPTLWYWHVELTGTATQYGLWGTYG